MLNQRKWLVPVAVFFFVLAAKVLAPDSFTREADAQSIEVQVLSEQYISTMMQDAVGQDTDKVIEMEFAEELVYTERAITTEMIATVVMERIKEDELELMTSATDHIVNYHGNRFAIPDDEYQVLLKIVEAEAGDEDLKGKMLVANVVLNRMEIGFGGTTISAVVFDEGQFEPVSNGRFFRVTPSEETIEAVERVLMGEDESKGALYFMAREQASKKGIRWFDNNLKFLFKHGGHEFFTEK